MSAGTTAGLVGLGPAPLDVGAHLAAVEAPGAGAVSVFVGQVRDHDPAVTGPVVALEYTAHPDALSVLRGIADRCAARTGVLGVAISHRTGLLEVGEAALVAVVTTAHRGTAFDLCAQLVDEVKAELPVWKREVLADGSHVWVGAE